MLLLLVVGVAACGRGDGNTAARGEREASAQSAPDCVDIERFAEALVDVGIAYDYSPSGSPAALAEDADAVFMGKLTGETRSALQGPEGDAGSQAYVGYDVEVTRRSAGRTHPDVGDVVTIFVAYNPASHGVAYYADSVTAGIDVAVIAHHHEPLGELVASIEGFIAACPGGPLLGWTGHLHGWKGLASVADVLDIVDDDSNAPSESNVAESGPGAGG